MLRWDVIVIRCPRTRITNEEVEVQMKKIKYKVVSYSHSDISQIASINEFDTFEDAIAWCKHSHFDINVISYNGKRITTY